MFGGGLVWWVWCLGLVVAGFGFLWFSDLRGLGVSRFGTLWVGLGCLVWVSFRWGGLRFDVFWFVCVDVGFCCLSRVRFGWVAKFRFTALVLAVVVGAFGGASLVLGLFWADVLVCF